MFQQMQYFISIVKNQNFTKAADECNISQSAISQQMKELEASLGITLLEKKGRSFVVTEAGQYFYTHAQDILKEVGDLTDNTVRIAKDNQVELRLGYLSSFGTTEFLTTVSKFSKEFPQVKINITSGSHEELFDLLRMDKTDLIFSDQRRALSNEYVNEFLTKSEFMVAVSNSAFDTDISELSVGELVDIPCILLSDGNELNGEEQYYRDVLGIKSDFREAKNYDEAQLLIASNQGYLVVNNLIKSQLNQDITHIVNLTNGGKQLVQNYYAYWKSDNSGYYIETFAELLKDSLT